ncbi:MAG: hypothetical protein AAFY17_03385 [Cyanobacteria bacterium J06642_11]
MVHPWLRHVAGAIALMLQARPNLNHAQATNLVIARANPLANSLV